jgi:hypothetical protein
MDYNAVKTRSLYNMSKPLLEILEGGDNTVEITKADEQYINMRLVNMIKTFKDGVWTINPVSYPMKKCDATDFSKKSIL